MSDNNEVDEITRYPKKTDTVKQIRIASIKLKKSMAYQIKDRTKIYDFICPLKISVGDYVLVETKRSSKVPFQVGLVVDVRMITYKQLQLMDKEKRPFGFAVARLDCSDFEKRCNEVRNRRRNLFKRYEIYDLKAAKKQQKK